MKSYEELLAERDALAAQLRLIKNIFRDDSLSPSETLRKMPFVIDLSAEQCLAEIKAEAGLVGYFRGTDDAWLDLTGGPSPEQMTAHRAIEYSNQVRQGEQSGTWLRDENVNGGKRQGGE